MIDPAQLLQSVGLTNSAQDRCCTLRIDCSLMPLPGWNLLPHLRCRENPQPFRTTDWNGRHFSKLANERSPPEPRFLARHLLLKNRRDEGFEHAVRAADPPVSVPPRRGREDLRRFKSSRLIIVAEQARQAVG